MNTEFLAFAPVLMLAPGAVYAVATVRRQRGMDPSLYKCRSCKAFAAEVTLIIGVLMVVGLGAVLATSRGAFEWAQGWMFTASPISCGAAWLIGSSQRGWHTPSTGRKRPTA